MKACLLLVAAALVAAHAASTGEHPIATLTEANASLFKQIVDVAGLTKLLSDKHPRVTILAPTDAAVKAFLKDMGLTLADVKANEPLADAIVAYHMIVGDAATAKKLLAKGDTVSAKSADGHYSLIFKKKADGVYVKDAQGNLAKVSKADLGSGNHTVHLVDKVLYSGSYFKDLASVVKMFPSLFSDVAAAADKAGLGPKLTTQVFGETIFLPTNAAFKKAKVSATGATKAQLVDILSYHVVPGVHRIPLGFKSGKPIATKLAGQDLTVTYKVEKPGTKTKLPERRAFVTDAKGNTAMVIKPNLFISKAVAHVVDGVLEPKLAAAPAAKPAAAAKPAPKAAAAPAKASTGRKLLQQGHMETQEYASVIALDSTEQSIHAAVRSGANPTATGYATTGSVENAELNSEYPEHATYADGVSGSLASLASGGN